VRLKVTAPRERRRRLLMELSAGPCVRRLPAALEVLRDGKAVARGHILGRSLVALSLPLVPGETATFVVRAPEGGYLLPPPPDSRVLDFAVHAVRWAGGGPERPPESPEGAFTILAPEADGDDVVSPAAGVRLECGWHGLRKVRGVKYRWADSGASLALEPRTEGRSGLRLWVGAGPSLRGRRATLRLRDDQGRTLCETILRTGPHSVSLPLPPGPGGPKAVFLHVLEDGASLGGKGAQAFRLFSCARSDAPRGEHLAAVGRALLAGLALRAGQAMKALGRLRGRRRRRAYARNGSGGEGEGAAVTRPLPFLHTNACGDFTLMAREHWHELCAYPELEMYSLHIDSVLMYAAHFAGLKEVVLPDPMRAYHIEHSAGSGWTPEGEYRLFERLRSQGIPVLTLDDLYGMARSVAVQGDPTLFCRRDWGLAQHRLPEARPGGAARAAAA
jgi:hypothetical protein